MTSLKTAEQAFQRAMENGDNSDTLNGIAYDPSDKTFFVTGKQWHLFYKIRFN